MPCSSIAIWTIERTIIKVDIDRNAELANRYRVQSVPTLIIFQNGEPVWRASGLHQAADLEAKINEALAH